MRPNVILVVFDTTRFDDWSYLKRDGSLTPVLDSLAQGAQRFRNAYSLYGATVPSHVTLFTGHASLRPATPADSVLHEPRYEPRRSSLFEILGAHGYRTHAFSGNKNISRMSLDALRSVHVTSEEFHRWMPSERLDAILARHGAGGDGGELTEEGREVSDRIRRILMGNAESVNAAALPAMVEHAGEFADAPFFLFLNYNDAHAPYFPEPPFEERFVPPGSGGFNGNLWDPRQRRPAPALSYRALARTAAGLSERDIERARQLHRAELAYADHHFGRLLGELERLGLLADTVIVCVSDHGELFGEYGRMSHAGERVPELVHVPLFIRFPDPELTPATWDARVDLRDVKPTLLDYLGIDDSSSRGRSLLPLLRGRVAALPDPQIRADGAGHDDENLIGGQRPETTRNLTERLRELGYLE